jgi:ubiquinone/menaquinone biosynthesis C-methylase UbiE
MPSTKDFFEQAAPEWSDQQHPDFAAVMGHLLAPFDPYLGTAASIVEIGAGTGVLIPLLAVRYPQARLATVDLAMAMLLRANRRGQHSALIEADVLDLPVAAGSFAAAICHNSFPHFHNHPAALAEIRRALLPGGYFLIVHDGGREAINAIHRSASSTALHHDLLPSGENLRALLMSCGYTPLVVEDTADHYLAWARTPLA